MEHASRGKTISRFQWMQEGVARVIGSGERKTGEFAGEKHGYEVTDLTGLGLLKKLAEGPRWKYGGKSLADKNVRAELKQSMSESQVELKKEIQAYGQQEKTSGLPEYLTELEKDIRISDLAMAELEIREAEEKCIKIIERFSGESGDVYGYGDMPEIKAAFEELNKAKARFQDLLPKEREGGMLLDESVLKIAEERKKSLGNMRNIMGTFASKILYDDFYREPIEDKRKIKADVYHGFVKNIKAIVEEEDRLTQEISAAKKVIVDVDKIENKIVEYKEKIRQLEQKIENSLKGEPKGEASRALAMVVAEVKKLEDQIKPLRFRKAVLQLNEAINKAKWEGLGEYAEVVDPKPVKADFAEGVVDTISWVDTLLSELRGYCEKKNNVLSKDLFPKEQENR